MERWAHKVLALFVILVVIFIFTALPIKLSGLFYKKGVKGLRFLVIINCFGGGVFFGAYLMHMSPEVKDLLNSAWLEPDNIDFPLPELFMGVGFFLLLFVEKGISTLMERGKHKEEKSGVDNDGVFTIDVEADKKQKDVEDSQATSDPGTTSSPGTQITPGAQTAPGTNNHSVTATKEKQPKTNMNSMQFDSQSLNPDIVPQDLNSLPPLVPGAKGSSLQSLILLSALSLDCIFEGMSLGLQRNSAGVWNLVIAILSHEIVIAFTLGLELFKVNSARTTFFYAVFYAFTAPVGITIGIIIMELSTPSPSIDIVSGVFQAISAGVFIYCTFLEVLPGQIGHNSSLGNIIAVFVGFAFMAAMALIPEPDEDPEEPGENPTQEPGTTHISHVPYLIKLIRQAGYY